MARRRRVALIIETSMAYGRRILRGIRRYVHTHQSWSIFLEQRSLTSRPPQWLEDWDGDGIISRTTTKQLAEAAARTKVPLIDLTDRHGTFGLPQVWSDDQAIAELGADHLLERGFRHFAFCGFTRESWSQRRLAEFASHRRTPGRDLPDLRVPLVRQGRPPLGRPSRRTSATG